MSSSNHHGNTAFDSLSTAAALCRYRVVVGSASAHLFSVTLRIAAGSAHPRRLSLPAWIPGSYLVRDFARNIVSIRAEAGGTAVPLRKLDKQTWELAPTDEAVAVHYEVYAWDLSVRAAYLDQERAYFNGTSLFLRLHDVEEAGCAIELVRPAADSGIGADWTVETTLRAADVDDAGFGLYEARSYWDAIDHPVQCAAHAATDFEVDGVAHRIALSGRVAHCDLPRLATDLKAICGHQARLFGALPVERYLFLVTTVGDGYGGLEHGDCSSLLAARDDLPLTGEREVSEGYRRFLGLCSHEYFHLWNVKRIQPAAFAAPDLDREVHTTLLWWFEGVTSYYDDLVLLRSQRISAQSYLELLARSVSRLLRTPGRRRQSIADSSFDAWTKFYKADENAPNAIVSYYLKGALVAWGLDVELRRLSDDRASLDDLLRALWERHGAAGRGLVEGEIEALAAELCGCELGDFFARYVYGTDELPLDEWCAALGIGLRRRTAKDERDEGSALAAPPTDPAPPPRVGLGVRSRRAADGVALVNVFDGGPAQRAGLSAGDLIVAIDGIRATADNLQQLLARVPASRHAVVHAFRRDELLTFDLVPEPAPADTADLWLLPDADLTAPQRARRKQWLGGG
jgi:predicted metalloprotease with PDZ domain